MLIINIKQKNNLMGNNLKLIQFVISQMFIYDYFIKLHNKRHY